MLMSLGIIFSELKEIHRNTKWYGLVDGVIKYLNVYNLIDIFSIGIFFGLSFRAMTLIDSSGIAQTMATENMMLEDEASNEEIMKVLETAVEQADKFRWWSIIGSFTIMLPERNL